uniref:IS1 protein InsB n=1 Tax=Klebsiella pneumoniae TaxID=573 RepID=A0A8B0ST02_KLEPN|nr:IS1 protein InsB [Klebsiella pneumoniae]
MELYDKVIGHYLNIKTLSVSWSHYRISDDLYRNSLHHAFRLTPHSQLNFATL